MNIGSVCTGYAGLDRAVHEVLGGELAWVADIDPGASAILAHRLPSVPNLGDITATDWAAVEPVDVLTAGFPCQDVSCAGARAGLREGNRTGVWAYVARAIDELRPSLVVLENVRGLLSAGADSNVELCPWCMGEAGDESVLRALGAVLGDLADLGFDAEWTVVPASAVGAPHRRERVFILAWPAADTEAASRRWWRIGGSELRRERLPAEPDDGRIGTPADADDELFAAQCRGMASWAASREWCNEGPDRRSGNRGHAAPEDPYRAASGERRQSAPGQAPRGRSRADTGRPGGASAATDASSDGRDEGRSESAGLIRGSDAAVSSDGPSADAAGQRHGDTGPQGQRGIPPTPVRGALADAASDESSRDEAITIISARNARSGSRTDDRPAIAWGAYELAIRRWEQVIGRPAPRPTEPGRTGERLSPRFVEWLMGLPEGWVTDVPGLSRNAQLKALGNGVVIQQAAMALRILLDRAGLKWLEAA